MELEKYGLNVPIYSIISNEDYSRAKFYKERCAVRFDYLSCALDPKDVARAVVVGGWPPLIAHSSPCVALELARSLAKRGCEFRAHVTDVTVADSVGAGVTLKVGDKIIVEMVNEGTVREITRKGRVDARAVLVGRSELRVEGRANELLIYCAFSSAKEMLRLPPGALEWSCHRERHGIKGDHVIYWELIELP